MKTIRKLLWDFGTDKRTCIYEILKQVCISVHEALLIIIIIKYKERGGDGKSKSSNECKCRRDFTKT